MPPLTFHRSGIFKAIGFGLVVSLLLFGSGIAPGLLIKQGGVSQGSVGVINCSTNLTCTVAAGVATVVATAGGGTGPVGPTGPAGSNGATGPAGADGTGITVYSGLAGVTLSNATIYFPIGGGSIASATEANVSSTIRSATTVSNFGLDLSAALGTTVAANNTVVATWRKNGVSTALTCTITNPAVSCSDTTDSFSAASGDTLDIQAVFVGTITATPNFVMNVQMGTAGASFTSLPIGVPGSLPTTGNGQIYLNYADINQVPVMTSDTAPAGVASSSTPFLNDAWKAFNPSQVGWLNNTGAFPQYLQYQFTGAIVATTYAITPWSLDNFPSRSPTAWTLQGSNDGTSFTVIDTRTFASWVISTAQFFFVTTPGSYTYYRLNITANGGNAYTGVGQLTIQNNTGSTVLAAFVRGSGGIYSQLATVPIL